MVFLFFLCVDILNGQQETKQGVVLIKAIIGFFFSIVGHTSWMGNEQTRMQTTTFFFKPKEALVSPSSDKQNIK
jgi:hypothetical protein